MEVQSFFVDVDGELNFMGRFRVSSFSLFGSSSVSLMFVLIVLVVLEFLFFSDNGVLYLLLLLILSIISRVESALVATVDDEFN